MIIRVEIWEADELVTKYTMEHSNTSQRRVLRDQQLNAWRGGQMVVTYPIVEKKTYAL